MMTNSEAIEQLKERYDIGQKEYLNFAPKYIESLKLAMESLKENDKLKAEIEQLELENVCANHVIDKLKAETEQYKSALTTWNNANNEMLKFNQELKDNIEQLKSELEQWQSTNLKLVCKLTRIECENNQLKAELEQSVKLPTLERLTVKEVEILRDLLNSPSAQELYERLKYYEDLAEQHLKGKVEE